MKHRGKILLVTLSTLLAVGCLHGPTALKNDLSQAAGVELDQEFGITLGRFGTWLAKQGYKIAEKHSDENDMPSRKMLKGVRKVSVGVYQVRGLRHGYENRRSLSMDDMDLGAAWTPLVRMRERGEDVFVMLKEKDERIKALLVVVAERDEWVLVKLKGNLNRVIEEGLRYAFDEMDRPDLYTATRRERGLDPGEDAAMRPGETVEQPEYESCGELVATGAGG